MLIPYNNTETNTKQHKWSCIFNIKKIDVCSNKRFTLHCEKYVQEKFKVLLQEKFIGFVAGKIQGFVAGKIQGFVASFEVEARSELANLTWKPILLYLQKAS